VSIEGVVEARNDSGIKLDGEWVNRSKFGKPLELPEVGMHVRAEVDAKGYLRSIDVLDLDKTASSSTSSRDTRICRLAVLKAAAAFGASRPDMKSADVLTIADRWLAWVEDSNGS
jgi:hypothetical protein